MVIPDWDTYYLDIAESVSERASCYRAKVGCIIVKDRQIVSTGYNGAPSGRESCFMKGFCYRDKADIESGTQLEMCYAAGAHAESNAIFNAAKHGVSTNGSSLYLVGHNKCCSTCQAAILNAGIFKVVLRDKRKRLFTFIPYMDFMSHPILDS